MRALRLAWGGRCIVCPRRRPLEFAHLRPTGLNGLGRGQPNRLYDILRHPNDYVLMCRWCHRNFDMGRCPDCGKGTHETGA